MQNTKILNITKNVPQIKVTFPDKHYPKPVVRTPQECYKIVMDIYDKDTIDLYESFYALYLSRNNEIIGYKLINIGTDTKTLVNIKLIVAIALKVQACSIIVAHNHPSGSTVISKADIDITKKLKSALKQFNIEILDHIIVTSIQGKYTSFVSESKL